MSENYRLLLVEDNPGDVRLIQEYLKDVPLVNVELGVVDTLEKAQKMLKEGNFDLVLLDLGLPDSAGLDTVAEVIAKVPSIPVVVLTGLSDDERAMEAINRGAQDYLAKDLVNTNVLIRSIRYSIQRKQSQVEIEESELKYRSLWNNSANGLAYHELVTDDDGKPIDSIFLDVNTSFEKITGRRREDIIGKRFSEVKDKLLPADFDLAKTFWKVALTGEPFSVEFHNQKTQRWFSVSVYSPSHGTFVNALQDITERKKAEADVKFEKERFISVLNILEDGIYVVDENYDVEYVNQVIERDFGPVTERKCYTYLHERKEPCPWCKIDEVFAGNSVRWEWHSEKNDRYYDLLDTPMKNADGSISKFEIFRDITESKLAEEKIRESEQRYRELYEEVRIGLLTTSVIEGKILDCNAHLIEIFGFENREQAIAEGMAPERYVNPDQRQQIIAELKESGYYAGDLALTKIDGTPIWVSVSTRIDLEEGTIESAFTDITERKKAEEALRVSEEKHRLVLSSMSDLIFVMDKHNVYTEFYSSDKIAPLGPPEVFMGKNVNEILPSEVAQQITESSNRVRETGNRDELEYSLTVDNESLWFSAMLDIHQDGESTVTAVRDITLRKKAEDDVKERESEYRTLVSNIPGAVYHCAFDEPWTMFFLSDAFETISGYPASDFIMNQVRSFDSIIHPDDRKFVADEVTKSVVQQESYTLEYRIINTGGMIRWIREYGQGIPDLEGKVAYLDGILFDVTEEKLAQEEMTRLREVQQASFELSLALGETLELDKIYKTIFNHIEQLMDTSIFIVSYYDKKTKHIIAGYVITDEGQVDVQNLPPIPLEDKGMGTQSQVIRTSKPLYLPDLVGALEKTKTEYTLKSGGDVLEGSPPDDGRQRSRSAMYVPLQHAGEVIGVMQVQSYSINAYSQEQLELLSNLANVVALAVENAKLFETVGESEDRFRLLVEGTLDGIFIHENMIFLDVNRRMAEMIGKNRADLIGTSVIDHWTTESQELIHEYVRSGSDDIIELDLLRSDGSTYRVEAIGKECLYDGKQARIVATRNITDQKKAQQETKQAADTALLYLDIMSHDVRNQLQAVVMASEIMQHMELDVESILALEIIIESVEKSQKLINKVLSTRELLALPLSEFSLKVALENSLESLTEIYADIQIETRCSPKNPQVNGDKFIEQLLMNILENAVEFNERKDRKLWIDIQESGQGFQVSIKDNGQGISDAKKDSLFDPSRRFGGIGIHQTIRILQKYGGNISIHDRVASDPTQGAEFRLWFPKAKEQ